MTVGELMDLLDEVDENAEVRLMTQPEWPFQHGVKGVWMAGALDPDESHAETGVVYIVEGEQLAYGDKAAWEKAS